MQVEITQLQLGDYILGGDPCRVVERKSAVDFLLSIGDGRLFDQLHAILASDFDPVLLLEGDPQKVSRSKIRPEAVRGALTYITSILHIPILPSNGTSDSASLVFSAARHLQVGYTFPGPVTGRHGATIPEQQMHVILSLPGIGPATARTLMTRFRSLHELLNADAAHLSTIPCISPTRAAALAQLLQTAFSPSDNGVGGEA